MMVLLFLLLAGFIESIFLRCVRVVEGKAYLSG